MYIWGVCCPEHWSPVHSFVPVYMMKYVLFDIVNESALVFVLQIHSMKPPDQLQMFEVSSLTFQSEVLTLYLQMTGGTWGVVRKQYHCPNSFLALTILPSHWKHGLSKCMFQKHVQPCQTMLALKINCAIEGTLHPPSLLTNNKINQA